MSHELESGDLAVVIAGRGGPNNVRRYPRIDHNNVDGQFPEHAVLAILPKPADWTGAYPHVDGIHVWFYARGRTDAKRADGRFEVIEGWTAASKSGRSFLRRMIPQEGCLDTMGTTLQTYLEQGQEAYVLPPKGLNVRKDADPHVERVGGLAQGAVVTVRGSPECDSKMVWWQVKPLHASVPVDWVSEGDGLEWFLAPLTLM